VILNQSKEGRSFPRRKAKKFCFVSGHHPDNAVEDLNGMGRKATETESSLDGGTLSQSRNQFHTHTKEQIKL
jgi:hypothetical protein